MSPQHKVYTCYWVWDKMYFCSKITKAIALQINWINEWMNEWMTVYWHPSTKFTSATGSVTGCEANCICVVRYQAIALQMNEAWEDVRVTLIRPDAVDPNGLCAGINPQDDHKTTSVQPGQCLAIVVQFRLCLNSV